LRLYFDASIYIVGAGLGKSVDRSHPTEC
jgi:hypothetical protein